MTDPYRRCPSADAVQRSEYADLKVYLPNDPLVKVDRMSMAHSLEVRCPLLDRRVVELAFRIPASRKQSGRTGKTLLRRLAQTRLPEGLWRLPKRGFTAPTASWLSGAYANQFRDEVLQSDSAVADFLDRRDLARRFETPPAGGRGSELCPVGRMGSGALAPDGGPPRNRGVRGLRRRPPESAYERHLSGLSVGRIPLKGFGTETLSQLSRRLLLRNPETDLSESGRKRLVQNEFWGHRTRLGQPERALLDKVDVTHGFDPHSASPDSAV